MELYAGLEQLVRAALMPDLKWRDLLQRLSGYADSAACIGFAERSNEEHFIIVAAVGPAAPALEGASFSVGEGFLGYVAVTKQAGHWVDAMNDPRALFFRQHGLEVQSIFCYPVIDRQTVSGVLFGSLAEPAGEDLLAALDVVAMVLGQRRSADTLQQELNVRTARLAAILELGQAMRSTEDLKNVLYLLLDMVVNLTRASAACIAFRRAADASSAELLSRGVTREQAAGYGRRLAQAYIGQTIDAFEDELFPRLRLADGKQAIECPLFVRDEVVAVLAAERDGETPWEELPQWVFVLSVMAGTALQRIHTSDATDWMRAVRLVHRATTYGSETLRDATTERLSLAIAFAKSLDLDEASLRLVEYGAYLTGYEETFIQEVLADVPEVLCCILRDYRIIMLRSTELSDDDWREEAQILALAEAHCSGAGADGLPVSNRLQQKFERYLLQQTVESQQIALSIDVAEELTDPFAIAELPPMESFTARELDVLKLLVTGMGNRDIAKTLFISEHTVKNHLTSVFQKLGVSDRTQAVALVLKHPLQ